MLDLTGDGDLETTLIRGGEGETDRSLMSAALETEALQGEGEEKGEGNKSDQEAALAKGRGEVAIVPARGQVGLDVWRLWRVKPRRSNSPFFGDDGEAEVLDPMRCTILGRFAGGDSCCGKSPGRTASSTGNCCFLFCICDV